MDVLLKAVRRGFDQISGLSLQNGENALLDALMSGVAMFILKDPLLFAFDYRRQADASNLERIFGIKQPPCATDLLELLDSVDPEIFRPLFNTIFSQIERSKALEPFAFYQGYYLLSMDGISSFSSGKVRSASCSVKASPNGPETYCQHVLGAAIVHPDFHEVIPLCPEMIPVHGVTITHHIERGVFQRFLARLQEDQPQLKLIVVEDSLSSNGPRIRDLQKHNIRFILDAKPGKHLLLFHLVEEAVKRDAATIFSLSDPQEPSITHTFRFLNGVPLNQINRELIVNYLGYEEHDARTNHTRRFSWVTDFVITRDNAFTLMRGGRTRWKIECETFNTLQNQGQHLESSRELGKEHLSEVLIMLMMLAFLIDQTQQLTSAQFRAAWLKAGCKSAFWDQQRSLFQCFELDSMEMLYTTIITGFRKLRPDIYG